MLTLNQAFIEKLEERTQALKPIVKRHRKLIGCGSNSIAISNTHHCILLITDRTNARNIEAFIEKAHQAKESGTPIPECLLLPTLVGINQDLSTLMNPSDPAKAKKQIQFQTKYLKSSIWTENVVYKLDKFDGSLEDFDSIRYKNDSVATIVTEISKCLDFMHELGFTHNDISERNILYKGEYPNLKFCLSDLGAATYNVEEKSTNLSKHHRKMESDVYRLARLEERLIRQLNAKPTTPKKKLPSPSKKAKQEGRARRQTTIKALKWFDKINAGDEIEENQDTSMQDDPVPPPMIIQSKLPVDTPGFTKESSPQKTNHLSTKRNKR